MIETITILYFIANAFCAGMYYEWETENKDPDYCTFFECIVVLLLGLPIFAYFFITENEEDAA